MTENLDYAAALSALNEFVNYERSGDYPSGSDGFGTARMERLLLALGSPQKTFPVVHIAGTKGKGSTAYLTAALLRARGWRVGLYTSPHVVCLRERIQIDGQFVAREKFAAAFARVRAAADGLGERPTFFEMLTAIALWVFHTEKIDAAVLEVGLGGRLDATNVRDLPVAAACVTTISLDHTQILGNTLGAIAREKAGIMRPEVPVVLARQTPEADAVLRQHAEEVGVHVYSVAEHIAVRKHCCGEARPLFDLQVVSKIFPWLAERNFERLPLNLLGEHQLQNAAAAFMLANFLCEREHDNLLAREDLVRAWKSVRVPGRLETVAGSPVVILDGAHNPASAWALTETLQEYFGEFPAARRIGVLSVSRDKDIGETLRIMLPFFGRVVFTENRSGRGAPAAELAAAARRIFPERASNDWNVVSDPAAAWEQAKKLAGDNGLIVITGSFYLVGDLRPAVLRIPVEQ